MAYLAVENVVKKGPNASRCEVAFLASRPARPGPSYASLSAGGTRTSQNPVHRSEPSRFSRTNRGQLTNLSSNWSSCSRVWLERFGWRFSGFHVAQLTARRGRGMFAGWHATASSFTKQESRAGAMSSDASGECRTTSESFVRKNFSKDLSFSLLKHRRLSTCK